MSTPIQTDERIRLYDVLRGFALIGIFLVNIPSMVGSDWMYGNPSYEGADLLLRTIFDLFIQTKFYTIFAFLFGVGFSIFLERSFARGKSLTLYYRRMLLLLLFGALHLLLWSGDILHTYALWGMLLPLFYRRNSATILTFASVTLLFSSLTLYILPALAEWQNGSIGYAYAPFPDIYNTGVASWFNYRIAEEIPAVLSNTLLVGPEIFSLFLFGLYVGRERKLLTWSNRSLRIAVVAGVLTSLPFSAIIIWYHYGAGSSYEIVHAASVFLSGKALAVAYVASFTLLVRYGFRFESLATLGRMALSNYLLQTVLIVVPTILLQAYGVFTLVDGFMTVLIILLSQTVWSRWWLERHRYGPLEYVWRVGTYGRL